MDRATAIARYIATHPVFAPYLPRPGYPGGIWRPSSRPTLSAAEIAEGMTEDVGFQALRLGGFLKTPDGNLIAEGVGLALPSADRAIFNLAVEALTLAANDQEDVTPLQVGAGVLVVGALLLLLAGGGRRGPSG